jgi:hypothetical protein
VTQAWAHGGTAPIYRTTGHDCPTGATDTVDQVGHFTVERGATLSGTVQLDGVASHSTFKMKVIWPSKASVPFEQLPDFARAFISEDGGFYDFD